MDEFEIILGLISECLGKPKNVSHMRGQATFNCVNCDDGRNKGNLEVSIDKGVYHCWACDISGTISKLFDQYGTKRQKKTYLLLRPEERVVRKSKPSKIELPEGYTRFRDSNPIYPPHREALNYLRGRGITDEIIEKYSIGYTTKGEYSGRIIVPSFNHKGVLNYFIGRAWGPVKMKYKNPEAEKDKIIFNEGLINWNKDLFIVEGVFDAFFLPNPVILLGKYLSELLFTTIYDKATGTITICLDGDAYKDAVRLYHELNGGKLYGRIRIIKLPKDKDVCDLRGQINEFYVDIK